MIILCVIRGQVLNNDFTTFSGPTRSILVYSDRPTGKIFNGAETFSTKVEKVKTTEYSVPKSESVNISNKSAYHSYYVFPRKEGTNAENSPNLIWHELNVKNTRGRSVSPDLECKISSRPRDSSMPASSVLVKKSMTISEPEKIKPNYR